MTKVDMITVRDLNPGTVEKVVQDLVRSGEFKHALGAVTFAERDEE